MHARKDKVVALHRLAYSDQGDFGAMVVPSAMPSLNITLFSAIHILAHNDGDGWPSRSGANSDREAGTIRR